LKAAKNKRVKVSFWGVRGSVPSYDLKTKRYGGNTSCVSLEFEGRHLICDAGTGIRSLGHKLAKKRASISLFISHLHWDHIFGLPFFEPIYQKGQKILVAGPTQKGVSFKKELAYVLRAPYFPIGPRDWESHVQWKDLKQESFKVDGVKVESRWVNHPDGALGFQFIFSNGKRIFYVTDHNLDKNNKKFFSWIKNADLLIHDSQFDKKEYALKKDWGHSTYETVVDFALKANVKQLVLFHHDPNANDRQLEKRLKNCHKKIKSLKSKMKCLLAQEGLSFLV